MICVCVCVCVSVCLSVHICQSKSVSTAFYICIIATIIVSWYMFVCVHIVMCDVCAPKGEVYANIVSQESISTDFIHLPLIFSSYVLSSYNFCYLLESKCFVFAEYGVAVCDIPVSGNATDVAHFHGFYCT